MPDTPEPVITVIGNGIDGPSIRWHRTLDDARKMHAVVEATADGVRVWGYLTSVPEEWVGAAKAAHKTLAAGGDVSGLATHRSRFEGGGGPLDPVDPGGG